MKGESGLSLEGGPTVSIRSCAVKCYLTSNQCNIVRKGDAHVCMYAYTYLLGNALTN